MTTYTWVGNTNPQDNTDFRAIGSGVSTALSSIGLVQTSDTGQVNWATVTKPGSTNTYTGYEIWRFDDSQQGSYPLFFKLEYGSTSAADIYFGLRITLGKGSNGSGTVTSTIGSTLSIGYGGLNSASCFASFSGAGMSLYTTPSSNISSTSFTIERSLDGSGNGTGSGVALVTGYYGSGGSIPTTWYVFNYATPSTYTVGLSPVQLPTVAGAILSAGTSFSKDGTTGVAIPVPFVCPGVQPWVSKQLIAIAPGDTAATFTASPHGTSHTYHGFPNLGGSCPIMQTQSNSPNLAWATPAAIYWQ